MKYFANYEADAVVREDDNGNRYIRCIENLKEHPVGKDSPTAWGIPSYGVTNFLEPISREEYETYGKTWDWSPTTGEKRVLVKN
ncbi:hypothetical protein EVA_15353 [gut metagenome]|uniref:Uncharacterized protein n=1 Tax=gut metagenome TaxID=749906 RepID=J9G413_9ZZZZ